MAIYNNNNGDKTNILEYLMETLTDMHRRLEVPFLENTVKRTGHDSWLQYFLLSTSFKNY